jgi:penicillin-insensitive murein endopeptidase
MIGGKVRSSKRMSPKRKSPKRKSSKRKSPKTSAWIRKLNAWRKAHRHVDGSLPSMKSAMKHCKGRSARKQKCRKNQGRKPSPKRKSPKRKTSKRRSKSPKRKTSKRKSPKRKSSKRKSPKKKSTKKRSYTRKPKALPALVSAQRDQLSEFRRFGPRLQQTAALASAKNAPLTPYAPQYKPQQQLSGLFGQALPQGMQNFQQQPAMFGPQTAQAYELRTGKLADGSVMGPQTRQAAQARERRQARQAAPAAQGGILGMLGF